eukprot:352775-Chlamydomonas_euryale.AAC.13
MLTRAQAQAVAWQPHGVCSAVAWQSYCGRFDGGRTAVEGTRRLQRCGPPSLGCRPAWACWHLTL